MALVEHKGAYAPASIAVREALGVDPKKFNVNGGAVSLGQPIGCSGGRVLTTLIYALKHTGKKRGVATLCLGGGDAGSMIVERERPLSASSWGPSPPTASGGRRPTPPA